MRSMPWYILLAALCLSLGFVVACSGDDDDDDDAVSDDDAADDDDVAGDDDAASECAAEEMCQFSVDCGLGYNSLEECLAESEAELASCADPDSFTDCVCDCFLGGPTCVEYLNCGVSCFGQFCD